MEKLTGGNGDNRDGFFGTNFVPSVCSCGKVSNDEERVGGRGQSVFSVEGRESGVEGGRSLGTLFLDSR
jgi:hypothetical protein